VDSVSLLYAGVAIFYPAQIENVPNLAAGQAFVGVAQRTANGLDFFLFELFVFHDEPAAP